MAKAKNNMREFFNRVRIYRRCIAIIISNHRNFFISTMCVHFKNNE